MFYVMHGRIEGMDRFERENARHDLSISVLRIAKLGHDALDKKVTWLHVHLHRPGCMEELRVHNGGNKNRYWCAP